MAGITADLMLFFKVAVNTTVKFEMLKSRVGEERQEKPGLHNQAT